MVERYELNWVGKAAALALADATPQGRLVSDDGATDQGASAPSVGQWAQQTFIEGDNLAVLRLLEPDLSGQVKLIIIDPPYNTGSQFVYHDDFGREHGRWLSMMAPRLVVARRLLRDDGVIVVSIDAGEVHQLALLLDEIFGEANRLNSMVWVSNLKGRQLAAPGAAVTHEHLLLHARDVRQIGQFRGSLSALHAAMPSVYKRGSYPLHHDERGPYVIKNELFNTNSKFNEVTAPSLVYRIHLHPDTGEVRVTDVDDQTSFEGFLTAMPHPNARAGLRFHAWRWSRARVRAETDVLHFSTEGSRLRIWTKVRDTDGVALKDLVIGPSTLSGQADLDALGLRHIFETPKPVGLLRPLVAAITSGDDLVLDFFAGSGSTAHAVAVQNSLDQGSRRTISINNAASTPPRSVARQQGYQTVSDITRERLRRVLEVVPGAAQGGLDLLRWQS